MSNVNPQPNNLKTIPPSDTDKKTEDKPEEQTKSAAPLEEDDEFEDFPVEDWTEAESQSQYMKQTAGDNAQPLWAEEWEDETEETDFAVQLKEEVEKVKLQNSQKMQTS